VRPPKFLLTTFTTWQPEQVSNAADDLLALLIQQNRLPRSTSLIRHLPVDVDRATDLVLTAIHQLWPDVVLCWGMDSKRGQFSLEMLAYSDDRSHTLQTSLDGTALVQGLSWMTLSEDAGQFVCNALYYRVLSHIQQQKLQCVCGFLHIPPLTPDNQASLVADVAQVLQRLEHGQPSGDR